MKIKWNQIVQISIGTKNLFSKSSKQYYKRVIRLKKILLSLILVSSLVVSTGCVKMVPGAASGPKKVKKTRPKKHIRHRNGFIAYKVKPGDSPSKIAKKYKMDLNKFLRINNLTERSTIYPGQQLYIEPKNELRKRFLSY